LFVKLDEEIHGLAHISQLNLGAKEKITDLYQPGEVKNFEVVSISPSEHRLGLKLDSGKKSAKAKTEETETEENKDEIKPAKAKKVKETEESEVKEEVKVKKAKAVKKDK